MSLPQPPPGFVVQEPEGKLGTRIAVVAFTLLAAVLVLTVFIGFAWALGLGVIAALLFALVSKDALHAAVGWNPPIIEISSVGYALGSTPTITYRRKPKRVSDIATCQVMCRLVCQESATYTRGSDTTTDTREVYENKTMTEGVGTADGLIASIPLDISAHHGAPSFALNHNKVRWYVEINVVGPRLPKDAHTFLVQVAPQLDERYRVQVQDT